MERKSVSREQDAYPAPLAFFFFFLTIIDDDFSALLTAVQRAHILRP